MSELERLVTAAVDQINQGNIQLSDLLKTLSPTPAEENITVENLPIPLEISKSQKEALDKVVKVFGKVVPTERRELTPQEVSSLIDEKETLDALTKMAASRLDEGIKVAIHNHLDVEAEVGGMSVKASRSKAGFFILDGEVRGTPDQSKKFTRETRESQPTVTLQALEALEDDPDTDFTHDDLLSITRQTRVLDENKLILHLRKNPHLVLALGKAITPGSKTVSINLRKA